MKEYPWGKGTPTWVRDATANDSDKSFTVPAGKVREYRCVEATLACTATVGSRALYVRIYDPMNNVLWISYPVTATASQIGSIYCEVGAGSREATVRPGPAVNVPNASVSQALPSIVLPAGYYIRVLDSSAVDAAADDLTVVLHYVEYDV